MELSFTITPQNGEMKVIAIYKRDDIIMPYFYLNRDVEFEMCICDGYEINISPCLTDHPMIESYMVSKIAVPKIDDYMELHYNLVLSGATGAWPYVCEKITTEFSLIRFETFCYPMFFDDWTGFNNPAFKLESVEINVPEGYTAITSIDTKANAGMINSAVAPYERIDYPFGQLYYLPSISSEKCKRIEKVIGFAFDYMNVHFGNREAKNTVFAVIPSGFGSFARSDSRIIFLDERAFDTPENLGFAIHEFIHLDWNVQCKDSVQRARFFDEAFTCYFENRVMREYLHENGEAGNNYGRRSASDAVTAIQAGKYPLIPIYQYGEHECGDLSYTIGSLCLEKLNTLLGDELFDGATADFLRKYNDVATDFDSFCKAYIAFCGNESQEKLSMFFDDWIYSCEGLKKHIGNHV
jgi:hypothetical protein